MTYLLKRGKGYQRRRAHLAHYDAFGQIDRSWCGRVEFNLTSNVPWGSKTCRHCINAVNRAS